jgi:hypothetical protein
METSPNGFPLRLNHDGSYSSLCPYCFCTVARRVSRDEAIAKELRHQCSGFALEEVRLAKEKIRRES